MVFVFDFVIIKEFFTTKEFFGDFGWWCLKFGFLGSAKVFKVVAAIKRIEVPIMVKVDELGGKPEAVGYGRWGEGVLVGHFYPVVVRVLTDKTYLLNLTGLIFGLHGAAGATTDDQ